MMRLNTGMTTSTKQANKTHGVGPSVKTSHLPYTSGRISGTRGTMPRGAELTPPIFN